MLSSSYLSSPPSSDSLGGNADSNSLVGSDPGSADARQAITGMENVLRESAAIPQPCSESDSDIPASEKLMKMEEESFYSMSDVETGDDNIWGLLSGVGGNMYEW